MALMGALAGPFVVAALLLGVGGALEVHRPAATVGALRAMRLPASPAAVRLGGAAALALCAIAVAWPSRVVAGAIAACYLILSAFVLAALRRETPLASCGCFGRTDTPATPAHLLINVTAAVVAGLVAVGPGDRGWESVHLGSGAAGFVLFAVLVGSATGFAYLALTLLPRLSAEIARSEEVSR